MMVEMTAPKSRRAVLIVEDPEVIRLLSSFIKSEILRLLSKKPMTETQLSKVLELTKAAVGYHLRPLRDAGLIEIVRYETQEHGISKYYSTVASMVIVDPDSVPTDKKRYFVETQMMHLEGMLSVFRLYGMIEEVSPENLEKLAETMLKQLKIVGQRYTTEKGEGSETESLRIRIFAEALDNLVKLNKYRSLFQNIALEQMEIDQER
jgi:DNA-binding transcriptional ArsR family regulator